MNMKKKPAVSWFTILCLILPVLFAGCHPKKPSDITREKNLPYELEMIIPAEEMEETLDVTALVSDLKEQVSALEKGLKGEDTQFMKTIDPLRQSLKDLDATLKGLDPVLNETRGMIKDVQNQIDRISNQFKEEFSEE